MTRAVAWLGALALTACAPPPTMAEYCEDTGLCVCADGACCSVGEQACSEDVPCCAGMECSPDAVCVLEGPVPQLELSPTSIDFGRVDADAAPEVRTIQIRNSGTTATRPLELVFLPETETGTSFQLDAADCARAELAPGGACQARVTFVPDGVPVRVRQATLRLREAPEGLPARELGQVALAGEAGHDLTVTVQGASGLQVRAPPLTQVTQAPPGRPVTIWNLRPWTAQFDAPGYHAVRFSAGTPGPFPLSVEVSGHLEVSIELEVNLRLAVQSGPLARAQYVFVDVLWEWHDAGYWSGMGTCGTGATLCPFAAYGDVTLWARAPSTYTGAFLWGGACEGTTGNRCVLPVAGRTDVTLEMD